MKLTKSEWTLIACLWLMTILIFGILMNHLAMVGNNGKMPVKLNYFYEDNEYKSYQ